MRDSIFKGKKQARQSDTGRMDRVRQEGEMLRHTLILFQDFQAKKTANTKKKIEENRASLPITPFANAIVQTLRQHRVLLIAGDTGCGKSTQGTFANVFSCEFFSVTLRKYYSTSNFDEGWI